MMILYLHSLIRSLFVCLSSKLFFARKEGKSPPSSSSLPSSSSSSFVVAPLFVRSFVRLFVRWRLLHLRRSLAPSHAPHFTHFRHLHSLLLPHSLALNTHRSFTSHSPLTRRRSVVLQMPMVSQVDSRCWKKKEAESLAKTSQLSQKLGTGSRQSRGVTAVGGTAIRNGEFRVRGTLSTHKVALQWAVRRPVTENFEFVVH